MPSTPSNDERYADALERLKTVQSYPLLAETVDFGATGSPSQLLGNYFQRAASVNRLLASQPEHPQMTFDEAVDRTLEFEGGGELHKVRGDPGGTTKWGISARAFPGVDIENLSKNQAKLLYKTHYWDAVKADKLPELLAPHVFDAAVNMGSEKAARLLQEAVNLIATTRGGPAVVVDGDIGPQTLATIAAYKPEELTTIFRHLRASEYVRLAKAGMGKFLFGWLKRA